jgi:hypothetical protein
VDFENLGIGGGGGLLGALFGFFGVKWKIDRVDKDLQKHKGAVVYTKTFDATIDPLREDIKEIKEDIKALLLNSTQRRRSDNNL